MKCLTTEEVKAWCDAHGLEVATNRYLNHRECESSHSFTIVPEGKPYQVVGMAALLVPPWEGVPFEGALLWIRERGIWSDFSENTADMIVKQMRLAVGIREPLETSPGHLFGPDEVYEMYSFLTVPVVFGWDAFLIPESMDYFVFFSHDEYVRVECRTEEIYKKLLRLVKEWNPREVKS
jgi:hypothetical protein